MENNLKECGKCFELLSVGNFGTDTRSPDGKKRFCKKCISQLNSANYASKSKQKTEQVLNWQKENAEKVKEYKRAYAKRKRQERASRLNRP
jgi:hypothetical protein